MEMCNVAINKCPSPPFAATRSGDLCLYVQFMLPATIHLLLFHTGKLICAFDPPVDSEKANMESTNTHQCSGLPPHCPEGRCLGQGHYSSTSGRESMTDFVCVYINPSLVVLPYLSITYLHAMFICQYFVLSGSLKLTVSVIESELKTGMLC